MAMLVMFFLTTTAGYVTYMSNNHVEGLTIGNECLTLGFIAIFGLLVWVLSIECVDSIRRPQFDGDL